MQDTFQIVKIGKLMYQNQPFVERYTWEEAKEYAKNLRLGGYDDWRLPTIEELSKVRNPRYDIWISEIRKPRLDKWEGEETRDEWIQKHKRLVPINSIGKRCYTIKIFIDNMPSYSFFWSSTEYENPDNYSFLENSVWVEYFNDIRATHICKENQDFVMCVRG